MLRMVTVKSGKVEGLPAADPRITAYKGIPYAAPPVGELRWRVPQPAKNWQGVLKAYKFGPVPIQRILGTDPDNIYTREWFVDPDIEMSEDSLTLNVWTPAKSADEKLPVFIWYYGGGYSEGMSAEMELDGERIARRGIVVVTVNYRVNAFGFLAHPELTAENPDAPTNFGFYDQRMANIWVRENIAAFGGDPDNITIGGQSAGGGSVLSQMASPLTKGLFKRVIVESGVSQMVYMTPTLRGVSMEQAERTGREFFDALGVKTLAEARALDATVIRDTFYKHKFFFYPPVDNVFQVGNHHELIMNGNCDVKPMLFGHTANELYAVPKVKSIEELKAFAAEHFGEDAPEFLRLVESKIGSITESLSKARLPSLEFTCLFFGEMKARTNDKTPLYYYVFRPEIPGWDNPGCFHSVDLWFFFETLAKCWRPFVGKHYDLSRQMCNYWANFIKSGDPNGTDADGSDMPLWEPYSVDNPCRMTFGDKAYPDYAGPSKLVRFLLDHELKKRG